VALACGQASSAHEARRTALAKAGGCEQDITVVSQMPNTLQGAPQARESDIAVLERLQAGPGPSDIKMVSRQACFKISSIAQSGFVIGMDPDLVYRGRTGTDLARVLKEQWPTTPVLVNSGHQAERRTFWPTSDLLRTRVSPPQEICHAPEPSCMVLYYDNRSCWRFQMVGIRSGEQY